MTTTLLEPQNRNDGNVEIEVSDVVGQQRIRIKDVRPTTPVSDLIGISKSRLALPPVVDFQMRDNLSSRLLNNDQEIGEVAREGKAKLTLQPDIRLG